MGFSYRYIRIDTREEIDDRYVVADCHSRRFIREFKGRLLPRNSKKVDGEYEVQVFQDVPRAPIIDYDSDIPVCKTYNFNRTQVYYLKDGAWVYAYSC